MTGAAALPTAAELTGTLVAMQAVLCTITPVEACTAALARMRQRSWCSVASVDASRR